VVRPLFPRPTERVGVLALQGDFREHIELLRHLGADAFEVRGAAELGRAEAIVLPGGESTTMSLLLETSGLLEPLGERLADGMPALGTCAGMILLAREILDGRPGQHHYGVIDISVRRNAFGRQRDSFEADLDVADLDVADLDVAGPDVAGPDVAGPDVAGPDVAGPDVANVGVVKLGGVNGLERPLHAVFVRAPVVERTGPDVEVLATVTMGDGAEKPVVCRQGPVLVTSFHPELAADPRLHDLFLRSTGAGNMRHKGTKIRKENVRAL
jgi:pyridoxal 5'-phosphate synthase pdxT subunit